MDLYFFDHATYKRLYSCDMLTPEQWAVKKHPSMIGYVHLFLGTSYQILYLPFLIVMVKDKFLKLSCYKLMFTMALYDVCATVIGSTFCGIFSIRGDFFCTNPDLIYVVGCFQASLWASACTTGLILLINRSLDLMNQNYAELFFGGKKTFIWLAFSLLFGAYICVFTKPFLFSAILDASMLNPYMGIHEIDVDIKQYDNWVVAVHNYIVAGAYPFLYLVVCGILVYKRKTCGNVQNSAMSKKQKQIILQSIIISSVLAITAINYMFMQYFYVPPWFFVSTHFLWQASHGASVFTYIFVNRSMRNEAMAMFKSVRIVRVHPSQVQSNEIQERPKPNNDS